MAHTNLLAGRKSDGRYLKEHEVYLYRSADGNLRADRRKRLHSDVFGSDVTTARSRTKYEDFDNVTLICDRAFPDDSNSMPVELLRNSCIVMFRMVLISRSAEVDTLQPYPFTSQHQFYICFLNKMGRGGAVQ